MLVRLQETSYIELQSATIQGRRWARDDEGSEVRDVDVLHQRRGQGPVEMRPVREGLQAQPVLQAVLQPMWEPNEDGGVNMTDEQRQMVKAEIDCQRTARLLKIAIGNTNTSDDYAAMITRERYRMQAYEQNGGILNRLGDILLVTWACVWLILLGLGEYLSKEV
jgi:hypothetical protein